jgi:hypothetical protein
MYFSYARVKDVKHHKLVVIVCIVGYLDLSAKCLIFNKRTCNVSNIQCIR